MPYMIPTAFEDVALRSLTPKLSRPQPGGANGGEGGLERRYHQGEKCRLGSDLERWVRTGAPILPRWDGAVGWAFSSSARRGTVLIAHRAAACPGDVALGFSHTEAGAEKPAYRGLRGSHSRTRRSAGPWVSSRPMP